MQASSGNLNYLVAFLGGLGMSFTPCIYPLIPITAGYIGASSSGSRARGFILSLIYTTGIAVTYSLLGLVASLTGSIFGRISTHPVTYFVVGAIIILFGLSMLELFSLPVFQVGRKGSNYKKGGYFSTFFFGLSSGLVISPCLAPVLGSILVYLATKKNIFYGMTLLLSFAYGMGLMLIAVGTFSAVLLSWPKLGKIMVYMKKAAGLILIGMGIYFISVGIRRL